MVAEVRPEYPSDWPVTSEESAELRKLRAEVRELRRANEILKAASAFLRRSSTAHSADRAVHQRAAQSRARRQQGPVPHVVLLRGGVRGALQRRGIRQAHARIRRGARLAGLYQKCVTVE
jgi:hypothetical protein